MPDSRARRAAEEALELLASRARLVDDHGHGMSAELARMDAIVEAVAAIIANEHEYSGVYSREGTWGADGAGWTCSCCEHTTGLDPRRTPIAALCESCLTHRPRLVLRPGVHTERRRR